MRPSETFHFNEAEYVEHIAARNFSYADLAREIHRKRDKRLATVARTGVSLAAGPLTGSVSIIGSALAGREYNIESHKLKLLEVEWARRGRSALRERRWREKVVKVAITVGTSVLMLGVDIGLDGVVMPDLLYEASILAADLEGYVISHAVEDMVDQAGEVVFDKAQGM